MAKMKTKSSAKKRFRVTGGGKIKRGRAGKRHLMRGKSQSRLRHLRKRTLVGKSNAPKIEKLLTNLL